MQYYARTNTGTPETGLITKGEFLTEKQVAALGEDRLADMVKRGVLGVTGGKPALTGEAATSEKPVAEKAEKAEKATEKANAETAADAEAEDAEDGVDMNGEDGGEELPELDAADAIDAEDTPVKPAKKGGRRKTK